MTKLSGIEDYKIDPFSTKPFARDIMAAIPNSTLTKWISIREALPPDDTDILIYSKENGIMKGLYVKSVVGESLWFSECFIAHRQERPTHWMLLPEAPHD